MIYKRPESVLVVIATVSAQVLLLQRRDVTDFWQSVTGSLRETETPLEAAIREVFEETGLVDCAPYDCWQQNRFAIVPPWRARYAPEVTHNVEHVFTLRLSQAVPIQLNGHEHLNYQWLPKERAILLATSYTNRDAIVRWV